MTSSFCMNYVPVCYGYDAKNLASIYDRYKCPICRRIFRNPVQLLCGHRICQLHLSHENSAFQCPECPGITPFSEIRLDKGLANDMQTLLVECIFCEWSGQMKIYQLHLEQSHNQCRCSYCDETFDSPAALEQHIQRVCLQVKGTCNLEQYGCKKQILRCDLPQHYLSEEHQRTLLLLISQIIANMIANNPQLAKINTHVDQEMIDISYKETTTTSTPLLADEENVQTEQIKETIEILAGGTETLHDELEQINNDSLQQFQLVETTEQRLATLQISTEESNANLDAVNTNLTLLQQYCTSLKQKVEERQFTSYDGTFIWRITNVEEKMVDAQSKRQVSIYSPPFYSSPSGYKMCARLYLHGDGNARRSHMSLFFVLMRSPNDSLLRYPFNYKVTFCLFDQSGRQQHIVDSFRPDTKSNSFQRPRCEMNIASGIPKFVSLSTFEHPNNPYVKADTMFIKVMVDFENLPKTILPYALTLNPGLPTHRQQLKIYQEIERRALSQSPVSSQKEASNNSMSNSKQQQIDIDNTLK